MLDAVDERPRVGQPTVVMPTHTPELFGVAVEKAVAVLKMGGLVALPTETVYGLAANAFDSAAVHKIFEVKGRPARNPIIVHVGDLGQARLCVAEWPNTAEALARAFWPGPLTMVLPRSQLIPDVVTARRRDRRNSFAQPSFHPSGDSSVRIPTGRAKRECIDASLPNQCRACDAIVGRADTLIVDGGQAGGD